MKGQPPFWGSLRFRTLALVLVAVLPILLLLTLTHVEHRQTAVRLREAELTRLAAVAGESERRVFENARSLLVTLALMPPVRDGDPVACSRLLADVLANSPGYSNLGLVLPTGSARCSAVPTSAPLQVGDRPWFQHALSGSGPVTGEFQVSRITGQASINVAQPIVRQDGSVGGVLTAAIDLSALGELQLDEHLPPDAEVILLDRQGTVLMRRPRTDDSVGRPLANTSLASAVLRQEAGTAELPDESGVPRLYAFTTVDTFTADDLRLVLSLPHASFLAEVDRQFQRDLLGLAAIGALVLLAAWFLSSAWIGRPFGSLVRAAGQIANGNLAARSDLPHGDHELGLLGRAFDEMATALEAREAERKLLAQTEKQRALGHMASGIAHDLNQSLALITGYADLARMELGHDSPDLTRFRTMIERILTGAQNSTQTVRRVLAFARSSEEQPFERLDLSALVRQIADFIRPYWQESGKGHERGIELETDLGDGAELLGDASTLREALTNLIFNAADAMPEGGRILLRTRAAGETIVEVVDSGVGMTEEVRARIFEPFFTTKAAHGTGLGLPQVRATVERHHGRIEVESRLGGGSTFRLIFPPATAEAPPPDDTRQLRVLAVDDEEPLAQLVRAVLEHGGHTVTLATSIDAALECLERDRFDVVISDLTFGEGASGWDLARMVQARWPGTHFVLATGWGAATAPENLAERGVHAVIAKPFRAADLVRAVSRSKLDGQLAAVGSA